MSAHILVAEDNSDIIDVIRDVLEGEGYRVTCAPNGRDALHAFERETPDLIVSDVMMPYMDGFTLLRHVRAHPHGAVVPFLFLSARTESAATSQARQLGADDFLFKPFDADDLSLAVAARLERRQAVERFDTHAAHLQTVSMLANVVEARDRYTRGHVERVKTYATQLAQALGWSVHALAILEFGALLHDLGKVLVPRAILNKPEPLLPAEWEVLQRHPTDGAQMLQGVDHLRLAIPYVLYHHEAWDGHGYPHGLAGPAIPIEGRLLAVVDAFDAMTSARPYRVARSEAAALAEIQQQAGRQFDPALVAALVQARTAAGAPAA
ncbi:MAG: response regulator [Anaerolineales bacterium]|nr:response regulator [Anaerolineales bacterium]